MKPATTSSDQIYPDMLWYNIEQFAWDFELEADPILERLDPGSKTKRIATNYGRFAKYLHEQKVIDDNDLEQSIRAAGMLEDDLRRVQRASWVFRQNDVARTFGTRVGNEFRPVSSDERRAILNGENGEDQTYEIAHIGENFVLADKCDDLGELLKEQCCAARGKLMGSFGMAHKGVRSNQRTILSRSDCRCLRSCTSSQGTQLTRRSKRQRAAITG